MKAVIINEDGFRRYVQVQRKSPAFFTFANHFDLKAAHEEWTKELREHPLPITQYDLDREYLDEFDETVLIYKERQ